MLVLYSNVIAVIRGTLLTRLENALIAPKIGKTHNAQILAKAVVYLGQNILIGIAILTVKYKKKLNRFLKRNIHTEILN